MLSQTTLRTNRFVQVPAMLITLALMWLFPFLVHLIPSSGAIPLGGYLLPIFFAPFLAAWLFDPLVSVLSSLLMPILNYTVTGMPIWNMTIILSLELTVFSLVVISLRSRKSIRSYVAPFAVLVAKLCSMTLVAVFPSLAALHSWDFFVQSTVAALPGIFLLALLNLAIAQISNG
jgi:membrane-associated HD superfamily phosphohydrolase